jgi:hypothetical protein
MPDVMEVVLSGPAIKLFNKALTSLAKIGALLTLATPVATSGGGGGVWVPR